MVSPKKSLGQNFLTDTSVLESIARTLSPLPGELVVEIGPGHGELTKHLLALGVPVTAVEKDDRLIGGLTASFSREIAGGKLTIVHGDALDVLEKILPDTQYLLIGNIPYYVTGHLIRTVGDLTNKPRLTVFTVQKEVAERVAAHSPNMNLLAGAVQVWADASVLFTIPRKKFNPVPKVDSAVLKLINRGTVVPKNYYTILRALFRQPRKTLSNNLRGIPNAPEALRVTGLNPNDRAQTLSVEKILKLGELLTVPGEGA